MGPKVDLTILERAHERFEQLSHDVVGYRRYVTSHRAMDAGGGLAGLILSNHEHIQGEVSQASFTAQRVLDDFAENFHRSWLAWRNGERYNLEEVRRVWAELPSGDAPRKYEYPPGFEATGDLGTHLPSSDLRPPTQLDTSIVVADVVDAIVNATAQVDLLTEGFKVVFRLVTGIDLDEAFAQLYSLVVGDWQSVGLLADLYANYGDYYGSSGVCIRDASAMIFRFWEGIDADVARPQCQELSWRFFLNQSDVTAASQRFAAAALGLYGLLSDLQKIVEDVVGLLVEGDEYYRLNLAQPLPVIVGELAGFVVDIAAEYVKQVRAVVLVVRVVKALLEIIAVIQAAFVGFEDRLPSTA